MRSPAFAWFNGPPGQSLAVQLGYTFTPEHCPPVVPELLDELELLEEELLLELEEEELLELDDDELLELEEELLELEDDELLELEDEELELELELLELDEEDELDPESEHAAPVTVGTCALPEPLVP